MAPEASATMTNNSDDEKSYRFYTLYFIRHAEGLHNHQEKLAKSAALSLAISQGHDPNSSYAKEVQDEARKAVLENEPIDDPPLSELGFEEAQKAKTMLEELIATYDLPPVEEVWVSPMQRTLQTAATIFPESSNPNNSARAGSNGFTSESSSTRAPIIRIKKEIEERQTGLACDKHSSFDVLQSRKTFRRFSLSCLNVNSLVWNVNELGLIEEIPVADAGFSIADIANLQLESTKSNDDASSSTPAAAAVEDKAMLRERTKQLFNLLAESQSRTICLIGHKGYLRELERGPLGKVDADLFENCEVRVYRLQLDVEGTDGILDRTAKSIADLDVGIREGDGMVGGTDRMSYGNDRSSSGRSSGRTVPVLQLAEKIAGSTIAT